MSLFTSVFRQLSACFTPLWGRRLSSQRAEMSAAPLAEAGESKAQSTKIHHHGHRQGKEGEGLEDKAEEALSLENILITETEDKHLSAMKTEMQSSEKLVEEGNGKPGEKKRKRRKLKNKKMLPLLVEVKPLPAPACFSSLMPVEGDLPVHPEVLNLPAARLKPLLKNKESLPHLIEVKPLPSSACFSSLLPVEGDLPEHPEVLALPAARLKALPPISNPASHPQTPEETEHVLPSSVIQVAPCVSPEPVHLSFQSSSSVVAPLCSTSSLNELSLLQSPPETLLNSPVSAFEEVVCPVKPPSSGLMLLDSEIEELEFMEYTETNIEAFYESEMKQRRMVAWLEQEEVMKVQKDGGKRASRVLQNPLTEVSREKGAHDSAVLHRTSSVH